MAQTKRQRRKPQSDEDGATGLGPDAAPVTLGRLLDTVGSSVAQVVTAPAGLDVRVGEPVIYDPVDRTPLEEGMTAWGMDVHRQITARAIDALPPPLKAYFAERRAFVI